MDGKKNGMTKVSIIITNYNYGKYLMQAIESALNQDYPQEDLEIILIDDASTDEATRRLVESYEHPRVRKILLRENVGVVKARNMAIEAASGEYILPLDADDYFASDYVRLAAKVLDENSEVGLTYARGELIGDACGPWLGPFNIETVLLEGGTPPGSMYRKSVWAAVGGYHDYMENGWEDWDFWLSVLDHGFAIRETEGTVGFFYRIKSHSRTTDQAEKHLPELWKNLFTHHQDLYFKHPHVMWRVLEQASHGRVIRRSPEYRLGRMVVRVINILGGGQIFRTLMRWRSKLKLKKN